MRTWQRWGRAWMALAVAAMAMGGGWWWHRTRVAEAPVVALSDLLRAVEAGAVERIAVEDGTATATLRRPMPITGQGVTRRVRAPLPGGAPTIADVTRWGEQGTQVLVARSVGANGRWGDWMDFAGFVMLMSFAAFMLARLAHGGMRRQRFSVTPPARHLRMGVVGGAHEARADLQDVIDFLREPQSFARLGARCPKGVLLCGPPGTGKTLLARAVAGEAGRPVITAVGSDFNEMLIGVGASRVRALAEQARKSAPCIVFIDEFDSIGGRRGRANRSGEEENTLNQLLAEIDGVTGSGGVVWMAATNRADLLDPAITRPGRFDRIVEVPMPTAADRLEILRIHTADRPLAPDVSLEELARLTVGYSGAELANLLNEAAIMAVRDQADGIGRRHIERARDKVTLGRVRAGVELSAEERYAIAVHEAGHAIVGVLRCPDDELHKITIEPRGRSLGAAHFAPRRDRAVQPRHVLEATLAKLLAGRAAERVVLGEREMSTGAGADLVEATRIARRMVGEFGMGSVGLLSIAGTAYESDGPSLGLRDRIDTAAAALLDEADEAATRIIADHRDAVEALAHALCAREVLDRGDVFAVLAEHGVGEEPTSPEARTGGVGAATRATGLHAADPRPAAAAGTTGEGPGNT